MGKIQLADIQAASQQAGWKVLSTTYTNLETEMNFECPKGHSVFLPWKKVRDRFECPICANSRQVSTQAVITKPAGTRRLLALDQASHTTGYAIFDNGNLVSYGVFHSDLSDEIARCSRMKEWLISMITNCKPDFIGFEGIQFQEEGSGQKMGITVFQTLARLQGILMETAYSLKIPFEVCPTNTWRHFCGVKGRTRSDKKRSMQLLVKQQYNVLVSDDESDAIGIGHYLTHFVEKNTAVENWEA